MFLSSEIFLCVNCSVQVGFVDSGFNGILPLPFPGSESNFAVRNNSWTSIWNRVANVLESMHQARASASQKCPSVVNDKNRRIEESYVVGGLESCDFVVDSSMESDRDRSRNEVSEVENQQIISSELLRVGRWERVFCEALIDRSSSEDLIHRTDSKISLIFTLLSRILFFPNMTQARVRRGEICLYIQRALSDEQGFSR